MKQKNTMEREDIAKRGASSRAPRRTRGVIATGPFEAVGLSGCGMLRPEDYPTDTAKLPKATNNPVKASEATFRHSQNLAIDRGTVYCKLSSANDPILCFTAPNGTEYALNPVTGNDGRPNVEDIVDGSVEPICSFAFSVCDVKRPRLNPGMSDQALCTELALGKGYPEPPLALSV